MIQVIPERFRRFMVKRVLAIFLFLAILSNFSLANESLTSPKIIDNLAFKNITLIGYVSDENLKEAVDYEVLSEEKPSFFVPVRLNNCVTVDEDPAGGGVLPLCRDELANTCSSYFYAIESGWSPKNAMDYKRTKPYINACGGLEVYGLLRESNNSHLKDRDTYTLGWSKWPATLITDLLSDKDSQACGDTSLSLGECERKLDQSVQVSVNNHTITFRYEDIERVVTLAMVGDYDGDGWEDLVLWQETIDTKGGYKDFKYVCISLPEEGVGSTKTCYESLF